MTKKENLKIDIKEREGVSLVKFEGRLDLYNSPLLKSTINMMIAQKKESVIIDFSELFYIDSSGIGSLISSMQDFEQKGGVIKFVGINKTIKRTLSIMNADDMFDMYDTEEDARYSLPD